MDALEVSQALETARQHQAAARWDQLQAVLAEVLRQEPNCYDALLMLGTLALRSGKNDVAFGLLTHAVAVNASAPGAHGYLGTTLHAMGRFEDAFAELDRAISLSPRWALP
jgi:Flp pilus assembly protein TadD